MRTAQVAIEDHRFYEHGGADLQGILRAIISNQATGELTGGGSTLTQQYVKITLQENALRAGDKAGAAAATARNYGRKIQELKYAIQLEKTLTKDQILEGYLNLVYYGDRAYGVEAASQHYFGHGAKTLNLQEAALLAGIVQNPGTSDPVNFPEKSLARRNVVLDRMKAVSYTHLDVYKRQVLAQSATKDGSGHSSYLSRSPLRTNRPDSSLVGTLGEAPTRPP